MLMLLIASYGFFKTILSWQYIDINDEFLRNSCRNLQICRLIILRIIYSDTYILMNEPLKIKVKFLWKRY